MKPRRHEFGLMLALTGLLICAVLPAQSPEKMSYQAVVRDAGGVLLSNQNVGIRIQILQTTEFGAAVYVETHTRTTNANGLVTLEIGGGSVTTGSFSGINWNTGPYFLKTEIDPGGGTSYSIIGTTELMSVPYALQAKSVTTEADPVFTVSPAAGITGTNITNWNTAFGWGNHAGLYRPAEWVPSWTDVTSKPTTFTPSVHTHGNITNEGTIGSTAGRIVTTGSGGTLQATAGTTAGEIMYWNGSAWVNMPPGNSGQVLTLVNGVPTWTGTSASSTDVVNPKTGKIWMDRNLGATQVAISGNDANSYGHLYQWGRGTDGHQVRTSGTTTTLSSSNSPGHGNFILVVSSPYDWRSPENDNLWGGVSGINNPCPSGYRLPTDAEWDAESLSWSSNNKIGAFASVLKLTVAGNRIYSNGSLNGVGSHGVYWSSTVSGSNARGLYFDGSGVGVGADGRAAGFSVRCIKE